MKLYQYLEYSVNNRIASIVINRPEKQNALNDILLIELKDAIMRAENDAMAKLVVLKANGDSFCEGADLDYLQRLQELSREENLADSSALAQVFMKIYRSTKVFIAQIEGPAIGSGCGLATVCDFAFSVPKARFGYTEALMGFVPAIVMVFLLRKVGETRAKELLLSGDMIPAQKAETYNLINKVVDADKIEHIVQEFANKLVMRNSAGSMQLTKKMIADIQDFPLENSIKFAAKMNAFARETEDCKRGIAAFIKKEPINW